MSIIERMKLLGHLLGTVRGRSVGLKRARRSPCIEFDIFSAHGRMFFAERNQSVKDRLLCDETSNNKGLSKNSNYFRCYESLIQEMDIIRHFTCFPKFLDPSSEMIVFSPQLSKREEQFGKSLSSHFWWGKNIVFFYESELGLGRQDIDDA